MSGLEDALRELKNHLNNDTVELRSVDTSNGPRVIAEHTRQRWYSPKYLLAILENLDGFDVDDHLEDLRDQDRDESSRKDGIDIDSDDEDLEEKVDEIWNGDDS